MRFSIRTLSLGVNRNAFGASYPLSRAYRISIPIGGAVPAYDSSHSASALTSSTESAPAGIIQT